MYNDIGKKIKTLAKVIAIISIVLMMGIGLIFMIRYLGVEDHYRNSLDLIIGLILFIVGPFLSWLSGFFIYGFGELIDKTCDIQAAVCDGKISGADTANREKRIKLDRMLKQGLITQEEYDKAMGEE